MTIYSLDVLLFLEKSNLLRLNSFKQMQLSFSSWKAVKIQCMHGKFLQSCLTLYNPMNHSVPGSSVHGMLQARILECIAMPSSRGSSQSRDATVVSYISCTAGVGNVFLCIVVSRPLTFLSPENPTTTILYQPPTTLPFYSCLQTYRSRLSIFLKDIST